jgi:hypothetical protein
MFQFSGSVWVGPGVREREVGRAVGTSDTIVSPAVGVGVAGGVVCVHPVETSRRSRTRKTPITDCAFMHRRCPRKI